MKHTLISSCHRAVRGLEPQRDPGEKEWISEKNPWRRSSVRSFVHSFVQPLFVVPLVDSGDLSLWLKSQTSFFFFKLESVSFCNQIQIAKTHTKHNILFSIHRLKTSAASKPGCRGVCLQPQHLWGRGRQVSVSLRLGWSTE